MGIATVSGVTMIAAGQDMFVRWQAAKERKAKVEAEKAKQALEAPANDKA